MMAKISSSIAELAIAICIFVIICSQSVHCKGDICDHKRNLFAVNNSLYIECIVMNSEPVLYCSNCVLQYRNTTTSYQELLHETDTHNKTCASRYLLRDKLNLVEAIYEKSMEYWNMGSCSECFDCDPLSANFSMEVGPTVFDNMMKKIGAMNECLQKTAPESVCTECLPKYNLVSLLYSTLVDTKGDNICFDIKDAMNKTNSNWVQLLKCGGSPFGPIPHEDFEYIIWSSIVGICSSAVSAAWFIYKKIYRSGRATYEFLEGASNDNTSQATSEPIVETESATPEPANGTLINLLD